MSSSCNMRAFIFVLSALVAAVAGGVVPRYGPTTVTITAPCESETATVIPSVASYASSLTVSSTASSASYTALPGGSVLLGPVSNPGCDPSDLKNLVPKSNLTLLYGSNDTSTPDCNAQISVQMKVPAVLLEDIQYVHAVACSDTGVVVTFNDLAGYKKSVTEWPATGEFILFTNHFGNCDKEFDRGLFLVSRLEFDETALKVIATAERSSFQTHAGSMQVDFGNLPGSSPQGNSTSASKRDSHWDPTYSLNFNTALNPDTVIASIDPYVSVTANTGSLTSSATFSGHLAYNFWFFQVDELYFDIDIAFDATLDLTTSIASGYANTFSYAPSSLTLAPVSIPGILSFGPALDFAIGAQIGADLDVHLKTTTSVGLPDGKVHVDLLQDGNSGTSGWTPTTSATANLGVSANVQLNPYVLLGVELAVNFLDGLIDLSSGVKANATLANTLSAAASVAVGSPAGAVNGSCAEGLEFRSDFIFGVTAFVASVYSQDLYSVDVPLFDKCWPLGG